MLMKNSAMMTKPTYTPDAGSGQKVFSTGYADHAGNLTASHPAIVAGIKRDSAKFRWITDLWGRGILK